MNKFLKFNELFDKAQEYFEKEAYTIASDFINSALLIDIDISTKRLFEAYLLSGDIKIQMEKFEDSITDFCKAIKIDPENPRGYSSRGFSKYLLDQHKYAIEDFHKAIELDPEDSYSWKYRGASKYKLMKYENAIKDFDQAIELDPKDSFSLGTRGLTKYFLNQYKEAIIDLDQATLLNPKGPICWSYKGRTKFFLIHYSEAITDLNIAIKLNPKDSESLQFRGTCKYFLNRYKEAIEDYERVIKFDPDNNIALSSISYIKDFLGNKKRQKKENFDLSLFEFSGGKLWVPGYYDMEFGKFRINATDISLSRTHLESSTILNSLPSVIEEIVDVTASTQFVRLRLGNSFLIACITRRSSYELKLKIGEEVYTQIKSVIVGC